MDIVNITNHVLSPEQAEGCGVIDLPAGLKKAWGSITPQNLAVVTSDIYWLVESLKLNKMTCRVLVSGHFGATFDLVTQLKNQGYVCIYAQSRRDSVEEVQPDGTIIKKAIFRHDGFYEY